MRFTIINVGYGDALLFQTESGYTALLDGGSLLPSEVDGNAYRIRADDFLRAQGIRHLDAVFISHIHEDHVCGLEPVLERCTVDCLYVPYPVEPFLAGRELDGGPSPPRSVPLYAAALNAYRRILLRARERGIPVTVLRTGDSLTLAEGFAVRVLAPKPSSIDAYMEKMEQAYRTRDAGTVTGLLTELDRTSNFTSLLLRFEADGAMILAGADNVPERWDEIPKNLFENVNVLKLPHHGQNDSIDEQIMGAMPLRYVITTASSDRRYGSASPQVYERLSALFPEGKKPVFLFSDEREYPPYFSEPEGFQAITLVIDSGEITPEFIKISKKGENQR